MDQQESQSDKSPAPNTTYVGFCPVHQWEGMWQATWAEAQADLEGHTGHFPDESH